MDACDFSRERKCAAIKDANMEHTQKEYAFFAILLAFNQKVLSAKIHPSKMIHTDAVSEIRDEGKRWIASRGNFLAGFRIRPAHAGINLSICTS